MLCGGWGGTGVNTERILYSGLHVIIVGVFNPESVHGWLQGTCELPEFVFSNSTLFWVGSSGLSPDSLGL